MAEPGLKPREQQCSHADSEAPEASHIHNGRVGGSAPPAPHTRLHPDLPVWIFISCTSQGRRVDTVVPSLPRPRHMRSLHTGGRGTVSPVDLTWGAAGKCPPLPAGPLTASWSQGCSGAELAGWWPDSLPFSKHLLSLMDASIPLTTDFPFTGLPASHHLCLHEPQHRDCLLKCRHGAAGVARHKGIGTSIRTLPLLLEWRQVEWGWLSGGLSALCVPGKPLAPSGLRP